MKLTAVPRERDKPPDFAATVLRLMTRANWSPEELARQSGLELAEVQMALDGDPQVPLDVIILLSRALKVKPGALVDGNV
jgi:transcriptional regulator with XRE-family HTH domain